ncbi:hypothetical protein K490DRAFT_65453 [Saccharata proteae CBS 121410]|uniref:Uncharacterized protein n=1 Tax=Saccharata proteae CBS 121410 TaxID=1314787 RepID=A0A9P4HVL5_9PEZI|nr:hypothetical protein K490DRAFT_65453 [Saccharata proteae CBS 121410]
MGDTGTAKESTGTEEEGEGEYDVSRLRNQTSDDEIAGSASEHINATNTYHGDSDILDAGMDLKSDVSLPEADKSLVEGRGEGQKRESSTTFAESSQELGEDIDGVGSPTEYKQLSRTADTDGTAKATEEHSRSEEPQARKISAHLAALLDQNDEEVQRHGFQLPINHETQGGQVAHAEHTAARRDEQFGETLGDELHTELTAKLKDGGDDIPITSEALREQFLAHINSRKADDNLAKVGLLSDASSNSSEFEEANEERAVALNSPLTSPESQIAQDSNTCGRDVHDSGISGPLRKSVDLQEKTHGDNTTDAAGNLIELGKEEVMRSLSESTIGHRQYQVQERYAGNEQQGPGDDAIDHNTINDNVIDDDVIDRQGLSTHTNENATRMVSGEEYNPQHNTPQYAIVRRAAGPSTRPEHISFAVRPPSLFSTSALSQHKSPSEEESNECPTPVSQTIDEASLDSRDGNQQSPPIIPHKQQIPEFVLSYGTPGAWSSAAEETDQEFEPESNKSSKRSSNEECLRKQIPDEYTSAQAPRIPASKEEFEPSSAGIDSWTRRASTVGIERHGLPRLINPDIAVIDLPLANLDQNSVEPPKTTAPFASPIESSGRLRKSHNMVETRAPPTRPPKRNLAYEDLVPKRQKRTHIPAIKKTAAVLNRKLYSARKHQNILSGITTAQWADSKKKIDEIFKKNPPLYFSDYCVPTTYPKNKVLSQPICAHASLLTQRTVFFSKARDSVCDSCDGTGKDELFVHKGQVVRPGQYLRGRRGGIAPGRSGVPCTECRGKGIKKEVIRKRQTVDTAGWKAWTVNGGGETGSVCGCRGWNKWEECWNTRAKLCRNLVDEVAVQAFEYEGVRINKERAWREIMLLLHVGRAEKHFHH